MMHGPVNIRVMKICSSVAGAVPVTGQTDMSNVIVTFWNFANAVNNTHNFSYRHINILTAKLRRSTLLINSAIGQDHNSIANMLPRMLWAKHSTWTECVRNLLVNIESSFAIALAGSKVCIKCECKTTTIPTQFMDFFCISLMLVWCSDSIHKITRMHLSKEQ
jgi:hypothetical protein